MATRLRKLKITRVAVCDQGANQDADILLFKRAEPLLKDVMPPVEPDGDETAPLDYATRAQHQDLWEDLYEKWHRFCDTFYDIIGDCDDDNVPHLPILVTSIEQFCADVETLLTDVGIMAKVSPILEGLATVAKSRAVSAKVRKQRLQEVITTIQTILEEAWPQGEMRTTGLDVQTFMTTTKGVSMAETIEGVTKRANDAEARVKEFAQESQLMLKRVDLAEARLKELEPLVARVPELEQALAKAQQTPEEQEAEWRATLPESVRKKMDADEEEKLELRKRLEQSEDQREQEAYIQKTVDYRPFGLVGDNWRILKAIDRMPEEERTELLRLMKASSEQQRTSGLFKARGSDGGAQRGSEGVTAEDQLDALIKRYQEEKSCDFDTAWKAVVKKQPDLWERNIAEKRASNRLDIR